MAERLLQGHCGHLVQEFQVRVAFHDGQRPVGLGVAGAFALGTPTGVPGRQGAVPHHADAAERTRQHGLLRLIGVRPALIRRPHPYTLLYPRLRIELMRGCGIRFSSPLKDRAFTAQVR